MNYDIYYGSVVLSSESSDPLIYGYSSAIILSTETADPAIQAKGDTAYIDLGKADTLVFDFTEKGVVLSSETSEPLIFDRDGDGYSAADDLWEWVGKSLDAEGGSVIMLSGADGALDQILLSANDYDMFF